MNTPLAKPKILAVDDTPANLIAMRRLLAKTHAELITADSGNEALAACLEHDFALILLDVQMPGMDGFEVAELLSGEERTRDIPIIFVTAAFADDLNRLKGYRAGAVDYIAKPINDAILISKVQVFLELYNNRVKLQHMVEEATILNRQLKEEVEERKRLEAQAQYAASHDALTGLPNRAEFMRRLDAAVNGRRPFALFYVDIDGFKPVNDTHGHAAGDELLKAIAGRLRQTIRAADTAARLGGDEFALIVTEVADAATAQHAGRNFCEALRAPYSLAMPTGAITVNVGASAGAALFPVHARDRETLIHAADEVMYAAKRGGKNQCRIHGEN